MKKVLVKKQYQVGGHIYTVALDPDLETQEEMGGVDHVKQRIYINPTRPETQMFESLIHELAHVINVVFIRHELGEAHITNLAQGLLQILTQHGLELNWSDIPYRSDELITDGGQK